MVDKSNKCGFCDNFEKEEGLFGWCVFKQSKGKDTTTFSMDAACDQFTPKKENEAISFTKRLDNAKPGPAPHMMMFGPPPSLISALFGANPKMFQPAGCNSCSEEEKKQVASWQNPVIRRKPGRKIVPWDEVKQRMANKKQIGNTDL